MPEKAQRRRFTAAYKLKVLQEAEQSTNPGELGALLRREGLYSSHLAAWRAARRRGELAGLARRRGPKPARPDPTAARMGTLARQRGRGQAGRTGRGHCRDPKKTRGALAQHDPAERAVVMQTIADRGPTLGVRALCVALRVPRGRGGPRALTPVEQQRVLAVLHQPRFADRAPGQVYATLLDEGHYLCSERTMYRLLATGGEVRERRDQLRHPRYAAPELLATAPNQLWSWDITKLRGPAKWTSY